ncbi:hypothetical protein [Nocardia stercoris]|uniref:Calcineurin-like phosphoesterase domain-containing protein n=1 Tax=Nocardia stercoris TaxID=2483361 RepID=A0A3M2L8K2_9NOCA|nr:hypothetical protein [Nocardia stercoris]RMI30898.1 hypothetical protein EBN03_19860 [Nocardia stercoris]
MPVRTIHKAVVAAAAVTLSTILAGPAVADPNDRSGQDDSYSLAVYGDAPYGTSPTDTSETDATPAFIDAVNADKSIHAVVHVGDIHSGSQYCTEAYDRQVAGLWSAFEKPLVYTPGDNEWADCHKKKEGGGVYNATTGRIDYVTDSSGNPVDYAQGNPIDNLALVRSIFFPAPGATLGKGNLKVLSQAQVDNSAHPADSQYVENVMWQRGGTEYVTINLPGGSNNDADPWYGTPTASPQQTAEAADRTAADLRWLDRAFETAARQQATSVVVLTQADMWDVDGKSPAHLTNYEPVIQNLAAHTTAFGKPVLLLNGDSHTYRSDNPLQQASPCVGDANVCAGDAWTAHPSYNVPNFHRIVVHGSTFPLEYLRLTVHSQAQPAADTSFGPFSWERVTDK